MKSKKGVFLAVPAALAIAIGAMAATDSPAGNHGDRSARRVEHMKTKLDLSDDQAKSIQAVFADDKGSRRESGKQLHEAMADFKKSALNGDAATLKTKRAAVLDAHGKMLDQRAEKLKKIGAILTPEQRTKFASMKHEGRGHGGGGWHHGRHGKHDDKDAGTPKDSPAAD